MYNMEPLAHKSEHCKGKVSSQTFLERFNERKSANELGKWNQWADSWIAIILNDVNHWTSHNQLWSNDFSIVQLSSHTAQIFSPLFAFKVFTLVQLSMTELRQRSR